MSSALAPAAALDKATRLFLTPPRFSHTARERELLSIGVRYAVASPYGTLAAWRFGHEARPAVLLSHGWGGRGAQFRASVPRLLEAGYQVIAFDHVAHGHSEGHEASLVHFVRGVDAVARDLEARGVTVAGAIGHSLGAAALGAWLRGANVKPRVVLLAPPSSIIRYSGHFARMLGLPERLRREMQSRIERRLGMAWSEFELPGALQGIDAPALVIHDTADKDVPYASGLAVARAWKGARFVATTGLGHRAILRSDTVVADTLDFLRDEVRFAPPPGPREGFAFAAPAPLL
ncbi:alpha/beta hydrolase [Usitatibacter rugosus]|uniref:alpha/beta hydrolase n=1 Tax=Usitatibacter rugosus TaxID=2732067 RepID=UPI00148888BD|nr:alpha/beta fold hydrolase [Usitatibacter rugosus]